MSFRVQKWPDISNVWLNIPSKKEANKKGEEKTMGGKIGRKTKEKKRKKKEKRKEKKGEVNKTKGKNGIRKEGEGGGRR